MAINVKLKPEVQAMLESAPEFDPEEVGVYPTGKTIARGLAEFEEYIKKQKQKKTKAQKARISSCEK